MIPLELNIDKISWIGKQKKDENYSFRSFLKGQNFDNVDKVVHRLNKEITAQIECQACGNCCKTLRPCVTDSEIDSLSKMENLSQIDFVNSFIEKDNFDEIRSLKDSPCKYLEGKRCTIYAERPKDCKSYPHTQKPEFISRTLSMIDNYGICPIVFNVYERLKVELRFNR
ncbi:MAG: YkgJ family cysteine cluster protein [Bacteroidales bacterium]|nr:YkgJ family cysteine cluster protein [Bacteroidales bacterium]